MIGGMIAAGLFAIVLGANIGAAWFQTRDWTPAQGLSTTGVVE